MLVGEIMKNKSEKIRVSLDNYKDHEIVNIRVFFENETGELIPTKKGLSVSIGKIDDVIGLLQKAKIKIESKRIDDGRKVH